MYSIVGGQKSHRQLWDVARHLEYTVFFYYIGIGQKAFYWTRRLATKHCTTVYCSTLEYV